ncbi:polysaccharide deacetylase family protein [Emticicia sp. SJ17W-69]|uniref:polysaccharide deacetylase family protein n=1 Tax=Emticicia sp. SJ17W-69 TaxID=3421657 RepID=UPI003EBB3F9A
MLYYAFFTLVCVCCLILVININFPINGIPVLMYHKFSNSYKDDITITVEQFEEQILFLLKSDYQIIPLSQFVAFINGEIKSLPKKSILLTFDDGYLNNLELAYPILEKYNISATIFLSTAHIGQSNSWDKNPEALLCLNHLKSLNPNFVSFGLHSHQHQNYKNLSLDEIVKDLQLNINYFEKNLLPVLPVFAYPFGGRPKCKATLIQMKKTMNELNIKAAFRIGNRLNIVPLKDKYEIQRLDIRGNESLTKFIIRLKGFGKLL